MNPHDIAKEILNSDLDMDDLELLHQALNTKRKRVAKKTMGSLKVGARVELINCKPQYLIGMRGTVLDVRPGKVSVELDEQPPTHRFGRQLNAKPTMIRVI